MLGRALLIDREFARRGNAHTENPCGEGADDKWPATWRLRYPTADFQVLKQMSKRKSSDKRVFALLGGGPASLAAAETLRQEGFTGRIVMVTREPHLPYDRVQLSKALDKPVEKLLLRPESFYKDYDIEVIRNASVTKLDTKSQNVHYATGESQKETLHYDKVLVATGGTPRKLFVPGSDMKNIFTLRTPEDAAKIAQLAKKGQKMIVVGGSFIGMEVASSLAKKGCDVAVIAMESVPFERVLGKKVGASFARKLQKEGVEWFGTSQVRLFRGNEAVNGVELEDGEVLPADAVVVGAGVLPNTRFVEGLSLDGLLIFRKFRDMIEGVFRASEGREAEACDNLFAAGDVCAYPALRTGQRVRIEHWDVAMQQGRVAAQNMLGKFQPFTTTPFFWSGLFGNLNLRFVGHAPEALDRVIIEGDVSNMEFISYYTEDDEIRAVATVNKDPVAVACAELMRRGQMPRVAELMLGTVNAEVLLQRLRDLSKAPVRQDEENRSAASKPRPARKAVSWGQAEIREFDPLSEDENALLGTWWVVHPLWTPGSSPMFAGPAAVPDKGIFR
ncbi:Apoptosis-inducing factor 3 [Symbiodinium microadriaticum]|uniref:Apoptosis-inducing factor 3 n=1 Tax=Symbiodinium microadriaticum TaxID=2951 RepID=A0A1Q9F524_SYMMI|nr:Apoptosis-inducing factor 3 [Symbiodinium microadriaticum]